MRRIVLIVSWVAVATLTSSIAWAVLSSADRSVGDAAQSPTLSVTTQIEGSGSSIADDEGPPTTSETQPSTPTTSANQTSPTTDGPPPSTTSTTGPVSSTSTSAVEWTQATVPSAGGVVVVSHRPGEVRLDSATPAPGFSMSVEDNGPDEVRVEFEGSDDDIEIRVRWRDGVLVIDVD